MKTIFILAITLWITSLTMGQTPMGFSYQAVARNADNTPIRNANISIRISIIKTSISGTLAYRETHQVMSNDLGLFTLQVGQGTPNEGEFSTIDWAGGPYFIRVEMDPEGGTSFINMGTSQLLSVPFANFADRAAYGADEDADPANEIQDLTLNGSTLSISNGNSVTLPFGDSLDADPDPTNEIQTLVYDTTSQRLSLTPGSGSLLFPVSPWRKSTIGYYYPFQAMAIGRSEFPQGNLVNLWNSTKSVGLTINTNRSLSDTSRTTGVMNTMVQSGPGLAIGYKSQLTGSLATHGILQGIVSQINLQDSSEANGFGYQAVLPNSGNGTRYGYYADAPGAKGYAFYAQSGRTFLRNTGIGMSNPTEMLEVNGNLKFNGATTNGIIFTDGSKLTSAANLDNDPSNELQDLTLNVLEGAGPSNLDVYQLALSNTTTVELPYLDLWTPTLAAGNPPVITEINSNFPLRTNTINTSSIFAGNTYSEAITVGSDVNGQIKITPSKFAFSNPLGTGMALQEDRLQYIDPSRANNFSMQLTNTKLNFVNSGDWTAVELGLNQSQGKLALYPGTGLSAYLEADILNGSPYLNLRNTSSVNVARMSINPAGAGWFETRGPNGMLNGAITSTQTNGNHGAITVYDEQGQSQAGLFVNDDGQGVVFADVKNFRTPNPEDPSEDIVYASLEGPEAAAYDRGSALLKKGKVFIPFNKYFRLIKSEEDMTIQLTPRSADSKGLAVTEISPEGFWVEELHKGKGNYAFFWEVKAVRKGFENYQVIRKRSEER